MTYCAAQFVTNVIGMEIAHNPKKCVADAQFITQAKMHARMHNFFTSVNCGTLAGARVGVLLFWHKETLSYDTKAMTTTVDML